MSVDALGGFFVHAAWRSRLYPAEEPHGFLISKADLRRTV
jgi:hypothetical protein